MRYGDWKVIRLKQGQALELYNLQLDPAEQNGVATEHPAVVDRIEIYLKTARSESEYWPG